MQLLTYIYRLTEPTVGLVGASSLPGPHQNHLVIGAEAFWEQDKILVSKASVFFLPISVGRGKLAPFPPNFVRL